MSWTDADTTAFNHQTPIDPPVWPDPAYEAPPVPVRRTSRGPLALAFVAGTALSAASFGLGTLVTRDRSDSNEVADASGILASEVSNGVAGVASLLGPSVVQVETPNGLGSGVVYEDGFILTNHHVIAGADSFVVRTSEGQTFTAELVGSDPRNDIAVLAIGPGSGLPVAGLAVDTDPEVGETAVAIGSPFQLQQTVTAGIVSALNRPVPNADNGFSAMIQTDAPINPGNSGGALANSSGQVIGINASIRSDGLSSTNIGIGFAIPIDVALDVAARIRSGESLEPGLLGVQSSSSEDNEVGVELGEVTAGSAAEKAGLRAGDRVLSIDRAPVTDFTELAGLVQSKFPGETIEVLVERAGDRLTVTAVLG